MNHFQIFSRPDHFERITFLGYWIFSLIIWSFIMNISLVIVIIFGIIGYHLVCKPLAFLLHHIKRIVVNYFFNGFNVYEAYYTGLELGRIARIITKVIFFIITLTIAKIFIELYLIILN